MSNQKAAFESKLEGGDQRAAFEAAVIERMKESGFLEVEIRAECLVRSGDDYQDELINFGWRAYQSALESPEVKVLRAISDEYNELIRHLHKGGDALEFLSRRAATGAGK